MLTLKADSSVCSPGGGEASVNTSDSRAGSDININKNIASLNNRVLSVVFTASYCDLT